MANEKLVKEYEDLKNRDSEFDKIAKEWRVNPKYKSFEVRFMCAKAQWEMLKLIEAEKQNTSKAKIKSKLDSLNNKKEILNKAEDKQNSASKDEKNEADKEYNSIEKDLKNDVELFEKEKKIEYTRAKLEDLIQESYETKDFNKSMEIKKEISRLVEEKKKLQDDIDNLRTKSRKDFKIENESKEPEYSLEELKKQYEDKKKAYDNAKNDEEAEKIEKEIYSLEAKMNVIKAKENLAKLKKQYEAKKKAYKNSKNDEEAEKIEKEIYEIEAKMKHEEEIANGVKKVSETKKTESKKPEKNDAEKLEELKNDARKCVEILTDMSRTEVERDNACKRLEEIRKQIEDIEKSNETNKSKDEEKNHETNSEGKDEKDNESSDKIRVHFDGKSGKYLLMNGDKIYNAVPPMKMSLFQRIKYANEIDKIWNSTYASNANKVGRFIDPNVYELLKTYNKDVADTYIVAMRDKSAQQLKAGISYDLSEIEKNKKLGILEKARIENMAETAEKRNVASVEKNQKNRAKVAKRVVAVIAAVGLGIGGIATYINSKKDNKALPEPPKQTSSSDSANRTSTDSSTRETISDKVDEAIKKYEEKENSRATSEYTKQNKSNDEKEYSEDIKQNEQKESVLTIGEAVNINAENLYSDVYGSGPVCHMDKYMNSVSNPQFSLHRIAVVKDGKVVANITEKGVTLDEIRDMYPDAELYGNPSVKATNAGCPDLGWTKIENFEAKEADKEMSFAEAVANDAKSNSNSEEYEIKSKDNSTLEQKEQDAQFSDGLNLDR